VEDTIEDIMVGVIEDIMAGVIEDEEDGITFSMIGVRGIFLVDYVKMGAPM